MVDVVAGPVDELRSALDATQTALRHYAAACEGFQALPHPSLAATLVQLNARRLAALRDDLAKRNRSGATADALYADLNVLHAGLLSLADATGRLRHIYHASLPLAEPAQGWFHDESLDGQPMMASAASTGAGDGLGTDGAGPTPGPPAPPTA